MRKKFVAVLELSVQVVIFYSLIMYFVELEYAGTENSREGNLFFLWSERVVAAIFTVEYLVRWLVARDKFRYPVQPMAIVDLLAVLPFYVGFLVDMRALRLVRTLRILRLFKFYRYNEALKSFIISFNKIKHELYIIGVAMRFSSWYFSAQRWSTNLNGRLNLKCSASILILFGGASSLSRLLDTVTNIQSL